MKKFIATLLLLLIPLSVYSAPTDMYVVSGGSGTKDGLTWGNAFSLSEFESDAEGSAEPGDRYFFEGGAYTITSTVGTGKDGTAISPIKIIGVNPGTTNEPPVYSDWAADRADQPAITGNGFYIALDSYWLVYNMDLLYTGTGNGHGLRFSIYSSVFNSRMRSTSSHASSYGLLSQGGPNRIINSEISSTNGTAAVTLNSGGIVEDCYIHDSQIGILFIGNSSIAKGNIVETCVVKGIDFGATINGQVIDNTIWNCPIGIAGTTSHGNIIEKNIISECTTKGINITTTYGDNLLDWNNFNGNTGGDVSGVEKGINSSSIDPDFTDAPNGDFSVGSAMDNLGFPGEFPGGLSEGFTEIGAVGKAAAAVAVAPIFSGIDTADAIGDGIVAIDWDAATGDVDEYRIYVREGSDDVFSDTYYKISVAATDTFALVRSDETNAALLLPTGNYYIGVRACFEGSEDSNTVTVLVNIEGGNGTITNMSEFGVPQ